MHVQNGWVISYYLHRNPIPEGKNNGHMVDCYITCFAIRASVNVDGLFWRGDLF